ncbi:MAG: hypothetical protein ABFC77_01320 [Thermoguttaceae bacterium]
MYIAVAVGTFLLGGWVLDSPPETEDSSAAPQTQQQPQQSPAPMPILPRDQSRGMSAGQRGRMANDAMTRMPQQQQQQNLMPSAPTESAGPDAGMNQPTAPTSGFINPMPGQRAPTAPTERRSNMSDSGGYRPSSYSSLGSRAPSQSMPSGTASFMTPPATAVPQATATQEKAFSGYRPTSGISPYMNLFRRDSGGTVDNYTTLVRPESDQRFLNQRFGNDIRGLQNSTRTQGINLQNLNQQNRTLQGVGTPQYYMNYGNYYPSSGQQGQ